jgi:hypothetical protein
MPKNKKKIEKELEKLQELIDKIEEARVVDPDDPDT